MTNKRVVPGQYFVLRIDFSVVDRSQDRNVARHSLNAMLNHAIRQFYRTYEPYLRVSANHLIENFIDDDAATSLKMCVDAVNDILGSVSPEDPLSMIKGVRLDRDICFMLCHTFHMTTTNNHSSYG